MWTVWKLKLTFLVPINQWTFLKHFHSGCILLHKLLFITVHISNACCILPNCLESNFVDMNPDFECFRQHCWVWVYAKTMHLSHIILIEILRNHWNLDLKRLNIETNPGSDLRGFQHWPALIQIWSALKNQFCSSAKSALISRGIRMTFFSSIFNFSK